MRIIAPTLTLTALFVALIAAFIATRPAAGTVGLWVAQPMQPAEPWQVLAAINPITGRAQVLREDSTLDTVYGVTPDGVWTWNRVNRATDTYHHQLRFTQWNGHTRQLDIPAAPGRLTPLWALTADDRLFYAVTTPQEGVTHVYSVPQDGATPPRRLGTAPVNAIGHWYTTDTHLLLLAGRPYTQESGSRENLYALPLHANEAAEAELLLSLENSGFTTSFLVPSRIDPARAVIVEQRGLNPRVGQVRFYTLELDTLTVAPSPIPTIDYASAEAAMNSPVLAYTDAVYYFNGGQIFRADPYSGRVSAVSPYTATLGTDSTAQLVTNAAGNPYATLSINAGNNQLELHHHDGGHATVFEYPQGTITLNEAFAAHGVIYTQTRLHWSVWWGDVEHGFERAYTSPAQGTVQVLREQGTGLLLLRQEQYRAGGWGRELLVLDANTGDVQCILYPGTRSPLDARFVWTSPPITAKHRGEWLMPGAVVVMLAGMGYMLRVHPTWR